MRGEGGNVEWKGIRGNEEIWRKGEEKVEWRDMEKRRGEGGMKRYGEKERRKGEREKLRRE